ncbi:hypothetical protein MASR2M117_11480 [Paludibacter sp.]
MCGNRIYAILTLLIVSFSLSIKSFAELPTDEEVLENIYRANIYWQEKNPTHGRPFWDRAAYHTGNMAVYDITKDNSFLDYSIAFAEQNNWKGATSDNKSKWKYSYGETMDYVLFGDWQTCFQVYTDLYNIEPSNVKIARAREVMEYQMSTPNIDYWWWVDALYMVMPVMTRLYKITGNPLYLEKLYEYWQYNNGVMYDEEEGLYFRDANYLYPKHTTNSGKKDFWSRGNGWAIAAFARVLTDLPKTDPHRDTYISFFKKMAVKLKEWQQEEGYWTRSVIDPDYVPGYETSGSAFFTYGILWGINNGYLSKEEYGIVAEKGWNYLSTIALQRDGKVGYVQPIGGSAIPGQYIDKNSTADFGVGAFLLAASEMYKYVGGDISTALLRLVSVRVLDEARVQLVFNDVMDASSVQNLNNYKINGQFVNGYIDFDNNRTVTLNLNKTLDKGKYTFSVSGLKSTSGLNISENISHTIVVSVPLSPDNDGIIATASQSDINNNADNTLDNKLNSFWTSEVKGSWIKFDLGKIREIYAIDIAFVKGNERTNYFSIELSTDNVNFSTVASKLNSYGLSNELERFFVTPQNARYVRVICDGNSVDDSNIISEVRFRYSDLDVLNAISLPTRVYSDMILPRNVIWSSSDAAVLSPTGILRSVTTDTHVELTASSGSLTKNFEIIVAGRNVVENNLQILYTFNQDDVFTSDSKTFLRDKSGNSNHAQVYGDALINGVLDLRNNTNKNFSTNGYLMAPNGVLDSLRSYSVLVKVTPDRLDNLPRVFDFGSSSGNSVFGRLDALSAGLKFNGGTTVYVNTSEKLAPAVETSLAFIYDAASKRGKVYVNGDIAGEGAFAVEPFHLSNIALNNRNYIGRTQWWDTSVASSNVDYCGILDDFYFFNTALTKDEIDNIQFNKSAVQIVKNEEEIFSFDTNLVKIGQPLFLNKKHYKGSEKEYSHPTTIDIFNACGNRISSTQTESFPVCLGSVFQNGIYLVKVYTPNEKINTIKLVVN